MVRLISGGEGGTQGETTFTTPTRGCKSLARLVGLGRLAGVRGNVGSLDGGGSCRLPKTVCHRANSRPREPQAALPYPGSLQRQARPCWAVTQPGQAQNLQWEWGAIPNAALNGRRPPSPKRAATGTSTVQVSQVFRRLLGDTGSPATVPIRVPCLIGPQRSPLDGDLRQIM
ncbi:hypothetical protein NDU88_007191 [Pleurodeles waltl]|uniref:Uncharacterized protein n=1 Tax=Pleurodeles waltl TaxID=8319 RepID=A0AAV7RNQ5_PLEWA|nr:hypothetical protein NDU88_007191 [Pleurodeles waltl]